MEYLNIRLKKNINDELAWALLSEAGIEVFSSTENLDGSVELYAQGTRELLQNFDFIAQVEVCQYEGIDWQDQWKTHGADYHEGFVHLDLQKYGLQESIPPLKMEAGPGFGDLSHPSTRLVLQMMPKQMQGRTVIDIGCGSGVLSIAAATLGAQHVYGIDIDEEILSHARSNASLNGLSKNITFTKSEKFAPQNITHPFILMNMIQSEQAVAWNSLPSLHHLPSEIITSGIRYEERSPYLEKVKTWGWSLLEEREEEGWLAFQFVV